MHDKPGVCGAECPEAREKGGGNSCVSGWEGREEGRLGEMGIICGGDKGGGRGKQGSHAYHDKVKGRGTNVEIEVQTDRQTDIHTDRQTVIDRQTDRQADRQAQRRALY